MSKNEDLYEKALKAITAYQSDTSVEKETTLLNLHNLVDEIIIMIEALKTDIQLEKGDHKY